jgi:hypothetical protein
MGDGKGKASDIKDLDIDGAGGQLHVNCRIIFEETGFNPG